ncbi:MAG TPA: acyltransferase, partial [Candidatus Krumholzibacteria bacterium]|nr:acyltransferase [Candidatus Krumholzibacteria bacterium]
GLAILAVMAFHFTLRVPDATPGDRLIHRVLGAGWAGVDLFFVLSGLLITTLLLDAKDAPHYFRTFYGRRALRIFPLYYGFLAAYFLLVVHRGTTGDDHYLWHEQGWWWSYLDNWWLAFVRRTEPPNYFWTGPFWSLAVEEQFYLVWPALVLLLTRRRLTVVCAAIHRRRAALPPGSACASGAAHRALRADAGAAGFAGRWRAARRVPE